MITLGSFVLTLTGLFLIALTQKRPRALLLNSLLIKRVDIKAYRILASFILGISFYLSVSYDGWSFGVIVWVTMISVSGILVSFLITIIGEYIRSKA